MNMWRKYICDNCCTECGPAATCSYLPLFGKAGIVFYTQSLIYIRSVHTADNCCTECWPTVSLQFLEKQWLYYNYAQPRIRISSVHTAFHWLHVIVSLWQLVYVMWAYRPAAWPEVDVLLTTGKRLSLGYRQPKPNTIVPNHTHATVHAFTTRFSYIWHSVRDTLALKSLLDW